MKDNDKFDNYIKKELKKTYSPPIHLNNNLILNNKSKKEDFSLINFIFFIISILQSLALVLVGVIFLSDILLKIIIVGFGVWLFNFSLSLYIIIINKEGVVI